MLPLRRLAHAAQKSGSAGHKAWPKSSSMNSGVSGKAGSDSTKKLLKCVETPTDPAKGNQIMKTISIILLALSMTTVHAATPEVRINSWWLK